MQSFFPNLEDLTLWSIGCKKKSDYDEFSVSSSNSKGLKYLFTSSFVKSLVQLEKLTVYDCEFVEGIVFREASVQEDTMYELFFPNLNILKLNNLPNLERFCDGCLVQFCSLTELSIEGCPTFKTFVSSCRTAHIMVSKELNLEKAQQTTVPALFDEKVIFFPLFVSFHFFSL